MECKLLAGVVALTVITFSALAAAQRSSGAAAAGTGVAQAPAQRLTNNDRVTQGDLANADAKAAAAKAVVDGAQTQLNQIVDGLKGNFSASDEYVKAKADALAAQSGYDTAHGKVIAALLASDDYKTAIAAREAAVKSVDDAHAAGTAGEEMIDISKSAMTARSAVSTIESQALAKDPDFIAAKKSLVDTAAAVKALEQKFDRAMKADPNYIAAKADLQKAQTASTGASGAAMAAHDIWAQQQTDDAAARARQRAGGY